MEVLQKMLYIKNYIKSPRLPGN